MTTTKRKDENNFKRAMNELLGAEAVQEEDNPMIVDEVESQSSVSEEEVKEISFPFNKEVSDISKPSNVPNIPKEAEVPVSREEAVIPVDMVISGNVSTKSNMKIMGSIIGDVECEGNICLMGNIQGNVNAGNLTIQKGGLTGDAFVREQALVEADSVMQGNISARDIYTNAKIEGQLKATGVIELKENAFVQGDITAGNLTVKTGAKIKGMVTISEQ